MASTTKRNQAPPPIASLLDNDTWDGPKFGILYQLWMERKRNPTLESAFRKSASTSLPTAASAANTSVGNAIQQDVLASPNQTNTGIASLYDQGTDDQHKHTSIMLGQGPNSQLPTAASSANIPVENAIQLDETTSPNQINTGIASLYVPSTDVQRKHTSIMYSQGSNIQLPTAASAANTSVESAIQLDELSSPNQTNTGTASLYAHGTDDQLLTAGQRPDDTHMQTNGHTNFDKLVPDDSNNITNPLIIQWNVQSMNTDIRITSVLEV